MQRILQFKLRDLQEKCEKALENTLTEQTVFEIFKWAVDNEAGDLIEASLDVFRYVILVEIHSENHLCYLNNNISFISRYLGTLQRNHLAIAYLIHRPLFAFCIASTLQFIFIEQFH